jgi:alkanesulfonate monooxygenase SsuD/methylene tetrahydromethanopterin reductase-like flavin-dependent oxidoreductase (luciferase family)
MKFGIVPVNIGVESVEQMVGLAQAAEAAGFESVWTYEHVIVPLDYQSKYPYPIPPQRPHPPVIIGGGRGKIYERIAKHGDGWFATAGSLDAMASALEQLRAACDVEGRDFSEIEITWMWDRHFGPETVQSLADMGVHRMLVPTLNLGRNPQEGMEKFAAKMIV